MSQCIITLKEPTERLIMREKWKKKRLRKRKRKERRRKG